MRNPDTLKASHDMIDAVKLSEPKREVTLLLKKKLLARAAQDQPSQRIRPQARGSVLLNLPTRLKEKARASVQRNLMRSQKALVDGSMDLARANLRKAKRATMRRASPRKALRKAPPRRASPRASATARARARSEAA